MKSIDTKWLYDFLMLESCRSFSQAALHRNLSQSAFSRRIKALEIAINAELFDRQSTPLQLTEQGKIFHSQARHLLQQLEINLNELAGYPNTRPTITIAAAHSLSLTLLPKWLTLLSNEYPTLHYQVEAIDVFAAVTLLREGKSDFIFSFADEALKQRPFAYLPLFNSTLYPVCACDEQQHPLFNLYQIDVPLLNYTPHSYMGHLVNQCIDYYAPLVTPRVRFTTSMSALLKTFVLDKLGIAWLPDYLITDELAAHKLVPLGDERFIIPIQAYVYRMDTRLTIAAEHFWQQLTRLSAPEVNRQ